MAAEPQPMGADPSMCQWEQSPAQAHGSQIQPHPHIESQDLLPQAKPIEAVTTTLVAF